MKSFLTDNPTISLFIAAISILAVWNIILYVQLCQMKKRLKTFFNGKKATDLEGVLFEEIKRLKKAEIDIKRLFSSTDTLKKLTNQSIKKFGVVRFNPFQDTGGDQSFVVALLDSDDNGLVISSLYTREGTRIYSKPIEKGKSKYPFSREEKQALKKAGVKIT